MILYITDLALASRQFLGMINDIVFRPRLLIVDLTVSDAEMDTVLREVSKQLWRIIMLHSCFVLRRMFLVIIGSDNIALGELALGRARSRSREQ